jgi:hypothetical protein
MSELETNALLLQELSGYALQLEDCRKLLKVRLQVEQLDNTWN